jgi:hypothetical protein
MEEYITRAEFEAFRKHIEQKTDEVKAVRVEVASKDVIDRLDVMKQEMAQELKTVSETWLDTLQEHYTEHKNAIDDVQTVQKGHAKYFEEHGKRLAATATKDDISKLEIRFDEQGEKVDQMFQILQKLQEKLGG